MIFGLSQEQHDLTAAVHRLAEERLAPRAAVYDRDASHPRENWHDLWEQGLLATGVPRAYGGMELDALSYALVLEEVAKACANTAMTMHMHSMVTRLIAAIGSAEQKERYFRAIVERGEMFGSWGSEPGVSITSGGFQTTLQPSGDGYTLNGSKYFCTTGGAAAYAMVWCTWKGGDGSPPGMTWAVVPTGHAGVDIHGDWNPLGLRGTVSPAVDFSDCRVKADWVLGKPGDTAVFGMGVVELFTLGWAAIYLGIGAGAFDFLRGYAQREGPGGGAAAGARRRHAAGRRRDGLGPGRAAPHGPPGGISLGRGRPRPPAAMDLRSEAGVRRRLPAGGFALPGAHRGARRAQEHASRTRLPRHSHRHHHASASRRPSGERRQGTPWAAAPVG